MRYKNLLSLSTSSQAPLMPESRQQQQQPPPTDDLKPLKDDVPATQSLGQSSRGRLFRFGSGGVKSKIQRAFSLPKQQSQTETETGRPTRPLDEGDDPSYVPLREAKNCPGKLLRRPTILGRKRATARLDDSDSGQGLVPATITERSRERSQLPLRSRHSWHADTLMTFFDDRDDQNPALMSRDRPPSPPPHHRRSLDMLTSTRTEGSNPPAKLRSSQPFSRAEPSLSNDSHPPPSLHDAQRDHRSPLKLWQSKPYRQVLGERERILNTQNLQEPALETATVSSSFRGDDSTPCRPSTASSREITPKQNRRRNPVPSLATLRLSSDTPSPLRGSALRSYPSPARAWEPLNVSRLFSPTGYNDERQKESDIVNTFHTPPTPYFSPLNDISPAASLSTEAWWDTSFPSPTPSLSDLEPQPEFQDSFELGQERLFDDVLASWGLPAVTRGRKARSEAGVDRDIEARMTRSQSIPLDLHLLPRDPESSHFLSPRPSTPLRAGNSQKPPTILSASTSKLLSDRITYTRPTMEATPKSSRHGARVWDDGQDRENKDAQSGRQLGQDPRLGPRFYPSGRSFSTIRAVKSLLNASIHKDELPFVSRPKRRNLEGRVKDAVSRFEGSRGDSPATPTRPLREIGEILNHQTSVSSLDLGSGAKRMMAEARRKRQGLQSKA
ncbi:hypothetical protein IAU59_005086 [Kwoniella sp. CBS 9459]